MVEKKPLLHKELRLGTILISIIGSLIVLFTPYKMQVFKETTRHFYFYSLSVYPILIVFIILLVVSSFLTFSKENTIFEIIMTVSSLLSIPSLIVSDMGQNLLLSCSHPKTVYLSAFYFAFPFFVFSAVWGSYLFVRKKKLLSLT